MNIRLTNAPIVIVEDDADDRNLLKKAFKECNFSNELNFMEDGLQLADYLNNRLDILASGREMLPALIILDLNLPLKDGREILREIKSHPDLKVIPVIVMTSSRSADDIVFTYETGVNCYITKPPTYKELVDMVKNLDVFWFETAVLPAGKLNVRTSVAQ